MELVDSASMEDGGSFHRCTITSMEFSPPSMELDGNLHGSTLKNPNSVKACYGEALRKKNTRFNVFAHGVTVVCTGSWPGLP